MIEVDVRYQLTGTYKATLVNVARVDGQWVAIVFDKESETLHEVDATSIEQWEV